MNNRVNCNSNDDHNDYNELSRKLSLLDLSNNLNSRFNLSNNRSLSLPNTNDVSFILRFIYLFC